MEDFMTAKRIGFISFRFAGTDGVTLETLKWVKVLERMGHQCFFMGGELETPEESSYFLDILHFQHPEIRSLYNRCFTGGNRPEELTREIHEYREKIKHHIKQFISRFNLDMLIPQNAITIPLHIPLGMAITEICSETGIPVIAHHHDFFWERKRFLRNCVWDYINMSFPPHIHNIQHVVINSSAQNQLGLRTGISSTLIPNVMDFKTGPPPRDSYTDTVREDLGLVEDELLILQPTRVVQRKGIENALELVARLDLKAKLVISHASGDEGYEYQQRVIEYSKLLGVNALFVDDIIKDKRGTTPDGRKIYTLEDIYPHADLVTYPSLIEGFGNALLETFWFRKPILLNNYSIYSIDIRPKGFKVVEMDNFISGSTIDETRKVLQNKDIVQEMTETNYRLGNKYYSYEILETHLHDLLTVFWGG